MPDNNDSDDILTKFFRFLGLVDSPQVAPTGAAVTNTPDPVPVPTPKGPDDLHSLIVKDHMGTTFSKPNPPLDTGSMEDAALTLGKQQAEKIAKAAGGAVASGGSVTGAVGGTATVGGGAIIAFDIGAVALAADTLFGGHAADDLGDQLQSATGGGEWSGLTKQQIAYVKSAAKLPDRPGQISTQEARYLEVRGISARDLKSINVKDANGNNVLAPDGSGYLKKTPEEIREQLLGARAEHEGLINREFLE